MHVIVLFGLPGAGKTFVGEVLKEDFGFYLYDGDSSLSEEMKLAIQQKEAITDEMRDVFFQDIIKTTRQLTAKYKKIVVAQTFIKEKYRTLFLQTIPEAKFILVQTSEKIREARLTQRKDYPLDVAYARKMSSNFDVPHIAYTTIDNTSEGKENIQKQLQALLR